MTFEGSPGNTTVIVPGQQSSGRAFDEELRLLLRSRLILVHFLALGFCVLLAALAVIAPPLSTGSAFVLPLAVLLPESLIGTLVLFRRPRISLAALRLWEVVFFTSHAAVAGYIRFEGLAGLEEAPLNELRLQIAFGGLASLQLFIALILVYGVLIPSSRQRSLMAVATLMAVPLAVLIAAAVVNQVLRVVLVPLILQWAVILLIPAAVAVFAATRASALQRRAVEAERRAEKIGQYALQRKLGEGGMGEVWLAEHALLKRPCAIKFIRPDLASHSPTAARFEREVRAVTGLSHPNTVRLYDYGRANDGSFYYVMEYLDGPTLEDLVRETGPLPPGRVVSLLRQLCGALGEAHACGLIHRDLKPANVIVVTLGGKPDVAKLLDFGLVQDLSAEADDRLTRTGTVLGTPAYMSPEQAAGESAVDARGDIYSLGAVAFFALTGRPPFQAKILGQLLAAHRSEPAPALTDLRADVPADVAAVVARCLAKDPNDRFQSAADLDRALGQCGSAAG